MMKAQAINAKLKPAHSPSAWWKVTGTILISLSCILIVVPMMLNTVRALDRTYPLQDFYILVRALLIAAGFATFHLAAYYMAIFRRVKRGVVTVVIGYGFITLGVVFGWLIFQA